MGTTCLRGRAEGRTPGNISSKGLAKKGSPKKGSEREKEH